MSSYPSKVDKLLDTNYYPRLLIAAVAVAAIFYGFAPIWVACRTLATSDHRRSFELALMTAAVACNMTCSHFVA